MSVLCLNVCRLCVSNIMSLGECLKNFILYMMARSLERQNWRYFRCPVWKTKSWYNSKPTWKRKHANSILESFEYLCQISSKSIFVILSYTVSKLVHFLSRSVFCMQSSVCPSVRLTRASDLWSRHLWVPPDVLRSNTSRPFDLPPVLARIHDTKRLTSAWTLGLR